MIKITLLYPNSPGGRFDHDYYETVHMPLSIALLGGAMRSVTVERGVSAGAPWPEPAFRAVCSFVCESLETYERSFTPHMDRLQQDMANYTDIAAIVQVSELVIDHTSAPESKGRDSRNSTADLPNTANGGSSAKGA